MDETNFTALDWCIVVAYLGLSVVIGLKVKKYVTNMGRYVGAGRALGTRLGVATMCGTEMGLVTVMYNAEKGFSGGFAAFHIALAAGVVTFFVGASGFIVFRLRELKVLTIPEFYEFRFGRRVRVFGAIMLAFGGILNMGLFLKIGSLFVVGVTGLEGAAVPIVMTALLALVLVYTLLGGMVSVVVTDYIQFVVLSIGVFVSTGLAIYHVGWDNIFDTVTREMGERGFNPFLDTGTFGADYVVWMILMGLVGCAIWPTAVSRALAMESPQAVKVQYMWSAVSFMIRALVPFFWGICAFVFFKTIDPGPGQSFFEPNGAPIAGGGLEAMPLFFGKILPVGVIGLVCAAMLAAFMSTHDSYLLVWSSVITQDIIAPLRKKPMSTEARVLCTRILIVTIGLYILYWGIFYQGSQDIWDYMAITGAIYFSGAVPVLVGGLYWKRASSTGAVLALVAGCTAVLGLAPVKKVLLSYLPARFSDFADPTGARIGLFTMFLTITAMIVGSILFPDKRQTGDES